MTETQKIIKYFALALAIFLIVAIVGGILSGLSFISFVFNNKDTVSVADVSDYSISDDVTRLYIDLQATDLEIKSGSEFQLQSNHEYLKVESSSDSLKIEDTKRGYKLDDKGYKVVLTVPENVTLHSITVSTGGGKLLLESFDTKALKLTLGAGAVTLSNVTVADDTVIEGGAGEITVNNCSFNDLDMQIGIGMCDLTATLIGESEINCGVGEAKFTLISTPEIDYTVKVDKALGVVTVDDKRINADESFGFGENEVEISCGLGSVDISFVDRETVTSF